MRDTNKTYSVFDLIEDKEVLTHVTGTEASEYLNTNTGVIYTYSQNGANFRRRYRITRNEELTDTREPWVVEFEFQWEQICNFLNPRRQVAINEQKKATRV